MFALSPIATAPTSLAVSPSLLAVPASDLVSTRITPVALAAPLANSPVANDARNTPVTPSAVEAEAATVQAGSALQTSTGTLNTSGPSSTFLAQLFSQNAGENEDNQIALASSYSRFAPAPTYTALVGYSIVKYRPSDAGLPSAFAPATTSPSDDNVPVTSNEGVIQAYGITQSRNQSNLAHSQPQFVAAG